MHHDRLLLTCVATGALVLAPAAAASAAPGAHHHGHSHAAAHGTAHGTSHRTHHVPTRDRLAGPRRAARHVLAAQSARLTRSLGSISFDGTSLNADDQAALLDALQADAAALSADLAAVGGATTVAQLNAIKNAAVTTATVAIVQVTTAFDGDAAEAQAADDATTLSALADQVAAAEQNGQDMTAARAALDDAQAQLAIATSDAQAAVSTVLALSPTATHADISTAVTATEQNLTVAQDALTTVGTDIDTVNAALGS